MKRHASEVSLGHLQRHQSKRGEVIRLHRSAPRYHSTPSPDGPSLLEVVTGVVVLLIWFGAIFWALPVIFTAVMEGGAR